ncbi:uncharacterized protein LOC116344401 [Contarinia nasturtii]|uniref:uncharacterized protein LOC116344401 n=1 Tax=Contarinia nasturtii TaxID=265458 RepID=UPI0012D475C0|nr:uncharacterized protein LOC116344401 [Contarinia nasturtii]
MAASESNENNHTDKWFEDLENMMYRNLDLEAECTVKYAECNALEQKYLLLRQTLTDTKVKINNLSKENNFVVDMITRSLNIGQENRRKIDELEKKKCNDEKAAKVQELKDKIAIVEKKIGELKNNAPIDYSKAQKKSEGNGVGVVKVEPSDDYSVQMDFMEKYFRRSPPCSKVSSTLNDHSNSSDSV